MTVKDLLRASENRAFAEWIDAQLRQRSWLVTDLCRAMGINPTSSLRYVLRGRARAAPKTLKRIAAAFDVDVSVLTALYDSRVDVTSKPAPAAIVAPVAPAVPRQRFALTMEADGTMRLVIDAHLSPKDAFKLTDQMRLAGLFGDGE